MTLTYKSLHIFSLEVSQIHPPSRSYKKPSYPQIVPWTWWQNMTNSNLRLFISTVLLLGLVILLSCPCSVDGARLMGGRGGSPAWRSIGYLLARAHSGPSTRGPGHKLLQLCCLLFCNIVFFFLNVCVSFFPLSLYCTFLL